MRKIEIPWDKLEETLKASGVLMEDDRTTEEIEGVTLAKPKVLLIFTKEVLRR